MAFTDYLREMDHFLEWYNLSNKRVKFAKMKLMQSQTLLQSSEQLLFRRNQPAITDWVFFK